MFDNIRNKKSNKFYFFSYPLCDHPNVYNNDRDMEGKIILIANIHFKGNKSFRLLNIFERLNKGEMLKKAQLADDYQVSLKTIQRDIDDLRIYLAETTFTEGEVTLKYDSSKRAYHLIRLERDWLGKEDIMSLCKILLESRAFCKEELNLLINKLLIQVIPDDRKKIEKIIMNEQHHYIEPKHGSQLLSKLWEVTQFIINNENINFTYTRQDGVTKKYNINPVAIMFSEYYFYLISFSPDETKTYPIIFRMDRIQEISGTNLHFKIPYKDRFNEGEFRKRVQFMYSGELQRITFEFSGPSLEAVLDKIPTAEILSENNGVYKIRAESYGSGLQMWLNSQGDWIKILT